jgi:hypothetical protein
MSAASKRWGWTDDTATVVPTRVRPDRLAFDRVEVTTGTQVSILAPDAFLALPVDERIRLNMERRLRFLRGDVVVPPPEAMRSLMRAMSSEG